MVEKKKAASKKPGKIDRFLALPATERDAYIQSLDRKIPFSETRPLTPSQRASWERAQKRDRATTRAAGRPPIAKGTKSVLVSVERGLLKQADAYAKTHGLKRTQLVAAGLRLAMANGVTADNLTA